MGDVLKFRSNAEPSAPLPQIDPAAVNALAGMLTAAVVFGWLAAASMRTQQVTPELPPRHEPLGEVN